MNTKVFITFVRREIRSIILFRKERLTYKYVRLRRENCSEQTTCADQYYYDQHQHLLPLAGKVINDAPVMKLY